MKTDETLVVEAQRGDRWAFEELVRRTSRSVYARLYLETGNAADAEDLTQETYMRAFRSIQQVKEAGGNGFRAWLHAVARSAALDFHRASGRKRRGHLRLARIPQEAVAELPARAEDEPAARERRERVRAALNSLPEEYRLPLMLRYLEGADYPEITMQLGLTNGSLKGLLHRGLAALRRSLQGSVEGGMA